MSVIGLSSTEEFRSVNGAASSSISQRIRALEEAGIKEAIFVKKRIPPYASPGQTSPLAQPASPNSIVATHFYGNATSAKIYQNPTSPTPTQNNNTAPHLSITSRQTRDPSKVVPLPPPPLASTSSSYSRYYDEEILKKPPPLLMSTNLFANEIANGMQKLRRTTPSPNVRKEPEPEPESEPDDEEEDQEYDPHESQQHHQDIPISIPILKPFSHRDSIDMSNNNNNNNKHLNQHHHHHDEDTSGGRGEMHRPDSIASSSSVNSLNSSLTTPHDKLPEQTSFSKEFLSRIGATNGLAKESYPFNRTLLNVNSFAEHSHFSSSKSSLERSQHVHQRSSDAFNNTTSNMSSPPSVECIKNAMRSSFENLCEASAASSSNINGTANPPSQLVSNMFRGEFVSSCLRSSDPCIGEK